MTFVLLLRQMVCQEFPEMIGDLGEVSVGRVGRTVYVVGEAQKGNDPGPTFALNWDTATWDELPARPFVGDHHGVQVFNGKFVLFGGLDDDDS